MGADGNDAGGIEGLMPKGFEYEPDETTAMDRAFGAGSSFIRKLRGARGGIRGPVGMGLICRGTIGGEPDGFAGYKNILQRRFPEEQATQNVPEVLVLSPWDAIHPPPP